MASLLDEKDPKSPTITIQEMQLGVWRVKVVSDTVFGLQKQWDDARSALPLYWRLMTDIFNASPALFTIFIACQLWQGIEDSILMHFSNQFLRNIEAGVGQGKVNSRKILSDIVTRLVCTVFFAFIRWYSGKVLELLKTRVTRYFELVLMKAKLGLDMPTSQEAGSKQGVSAQQAWDALQNIFKFGTDLIRIASHILLIARISRWSGGPVYTLLCISQPLFSAFNRRDLWDKVCFGFVNNTFYLRMKSLEKLASGAFRQDIISGGLGSWIADEFYKSHLHLVKIPEGHPYQLYSESSVLQDILSKILGDSPVVRFFHFCALQAIKDPAAFSVASIAILQQSSTSLKYSITMVMRTSQRFRSSVTSVKSIYASTGVINSMVVGHVPYPRVDEKSEDADGSKGMGFELKNVSFSYPGTRSITPALKNISLIIKPGQLVVIVGANGSGKSTLIRILSRLYDPSSGQILIDGLPSSSHRIDDLHAATTLLSQDNLLYPLSLGENIGLGYPECVNDKEMIRDAAEKGGALEVVQKLKDGMDTELDPTVETFELGLYGNKTHPLYEEMEKMPKSINVSGGEKQRIVAARSFMRFNSGKVKFVAVDEPSSALDAEGELRLFENLLAVREGKTTVFVTHRFGHLTKHANIIICMKEGNILEMGSHAELLQKKGEYANLYEIQAGAFSDTTSKRKEHFKPQVLG
ncbi:P-loop containing nucleoside triphosphate hydrolase protein [Gymnopilus junonius]|uniref:P-loop containing nucleoside triphosphate hydrolase protein n=1 Tax=Gymnopilus junonius TaxID=109634 RepID=A0A9P5NJ75_GYMJU|nr:P-loop containing nucleoside triphosphate hydrolase protein [Gymnopilus junonius]